MKDYIICERYYLDTLSVVIGEGYTLEEAKLVVDNHRDNDSNLQYAYTIYKISKETGNLERIKY